MKYLLEIEIKTSFISSEDCKIINKFAQFPFIKKIYCLHPHPSCKVPDNLIHNNYVFYKILR